MRILTALARPGLELEDAVITADGMPLLGRGTRLRRRHLLMLHAEGIPVLEVVDDERIESWERLPTPDMFLRQLDARFRPVERDRRTMAFKDAVRAVYLDFLRELG